MIEHMIPGHMLELGPDEEIQHPDQSIKDAMVCHWPEGVPITTKNWLIVFNHFKANGQFLHADEVTSLISPK